VQLNVTVPVVVLSCSGRASVQRIEKNDRRPDLDSSRQRWCRAKVGTKLGVGWMGEGSSKGCEGLGLSSLQGEEGKGEASPGGKGGNAGH
jgi:hypothetical protein